VLNVFIRHIFEIKQVLSSSNTNARRRYMLRNKTSMCLFIIAVFVANFLVVPYLDAQEPKIKVNVTPKSEAKSQKVESQKGKTSGENQPAIVIEQRIFDAGEVWEGDIVTHSFVVKNTGKGQLNITNVKPG
jgi:archaellum component FlaG (FlaF/FlaG flagellin family)